MAVDPFLRRVAGSGPVLAKLWPSHPFLPNFLPVACTVASGGSSELLAHSTPALRRRESLGESVHSKPAGAHRTDRMRNTAHAAGMFRVSRVGRASHAMKSRECSETVARGVR